MQSVLAEHSGGIPLLLLPPVPPTPPTPPVPPPPVLPLLDEALVEGVDVVLVPPSQPMNWIAAIPTHAAKNQARSIFMGKHSSLTATSAVTWGYTDVFLLGAALMLDERAAPSGTKEASEGVYQAAARTGASVSLTQRTEVRFASASLAPIRSRRLINTLSASVHEMITRNATGLYGINYGEHGGQVPPQSIPVSSPFCV